MPSQPPATTERGSDISKSVNTPMAVHQSWMQTDPDVHAESNVCAGTWTRLHGCSEEGMTVTFAETFDILSDIEAVHHSAPCEFISNPQFGSH